MSIHSKTRLLVHIVWSTYKRRPIRSASTRVAVNQYLNAYAEEHSIRILTSFTNADHVHLLINLDPVMSVASTVKLLKGATSRWMNQQRDLPRRFSWGRGYGAFSVSQSHAKRVIQYIRNQEEHHRRKAFGDEFDRFLDKYELNATNS